MASKKNTSPIAILIFRLLTFILLLISLFVLATDHKTVQFPFPNTNLRFKNYYADRYVLSVAAIGCLHMLLQVPFAAINVGSGTIAGGNEHMMLYLIFADMVFSLLLMSGVGAGIGVTVEAKAYGNKIFRLLFGDDYSAGLDKEQSDMNRFFDVVHVSTGLLLMATVCMVIITFISVSALAKK